MPLFTRERVINGLIITGVLLTVFCIAGCGGARQGMPERVGGLLGAKVEDGACAYTDHLVAFFDSATETRPHDIQRIGQGCRCTYKIAGVTYVPLQTFPNEMCEAYKLKMLKEQENERAGSDESAPAEPGAEGL